MQQHITSHKNSRDTQRHSQIRIQSGFVNSKEVFITLITHWNVGPHALPVSE